MSDEDFYVYVPDFDLVEFRCLALRYVKLLIRARWKCEPGFLPPDALKHWKLVNIDEDRLSAWKLLEDVVTTLRTLHEDYLGICPSGGIPATNQSTPVGRLIDSLIYLTPPAGGGDFPNEYLLDALRRLKDGEQGIDWQSLIDWSLLEKIRADLDLLPVNEGSGIDSKFQQRNDDSADSHELLPSYLGLIVDTDNQTISREGYPGISVDLSNCPVLWPMFLILYERKERSLMPDALLQLLEKRIEHEPERETIVRQISNLRKKLERLKVTIESKKYRLSDCSEGC